MLEPSAKIKENYHSLVVETDRGKLITGIKLRETNDSLILRDAEDQVVTIPLDSIEEQTDGGSLMPAGLLNDLTEQETYDLLRFLTELGKIGDFALPQQPYMRTYQTLTAGADLGGRREHNVSTSNNLPWSDVYSRVAGDLPTEGLPRHRARNSQHSAIYLRFPIEMTSDGSRTLKLDDGVRARIYVDGKLEGSEQQTKLVLKTGTHLITLVIDDIDAARPVRASVD